MAMQNHKTSPIWLNPERVIRHLALCGLMGVGKTTVGGIVATRLHRPLLDNDLALRQLTGQTADELARRDGIDALHAWEATALRVLLHTTSPAVVTAAASTITEQDCRATLREKSMVVWLDADPSLAAARMAGGLHRPTTGAIGRRDAASIAVLRAERAPWFRQVADLKVDTGVHDPAAAADLILAALATATRYGA
jgi:shikimate kinase